MVPPAYRRLLASCFLGYLLSPCFAFAQYFSSAQTWGEVAEYTSLTPIAQGDTSFASHASGARIASMRGYPQPYSSAAIPPASAVSGYGCYPQQAEHCESGHPACGPSAGCDCRPTNYRQFRPCNVWYASAAGLYLERDDARRIWTTHETNNNSNQLMNTQDVDPDGEFGADLRLGRFFACNRWAMELGYWSVNNFEASTRESHANLVSSPLLFNDLEFAVGDPVVDYFDSAAEHRLFRSNEIHNVELNLIQAKSDCHNTRRWTSRLSVGVRYFKFDEDLSFSTLDQGGIWGGSGGLEEVNLTSSVKNDLIGAQLGGRFQRPIGSRTLFNISPSFGVYNNHVEQRFDLRRGDGTAAVPTAFSGIAGNYPVETSTDEVAFLSELNLGLQHQVTYRWTLFGGYRVVILTNVGLADDQLPQYIVDIPEIADIDTHGSLVLHGAFFGVGRSF